ncbi:Tn3 family transposase [Bacillus mobilis]|uniref:Tn3 family transposase n=1 Tax=Bacillus mobilis TaxID=2026190 RepID=UPI0036CC9DAC
MSDTEYWLNWTRLFGPISGYDAKIVKPSQRYLTTAFCYGCNLGPYSSSPFPWYSGSKTDFLD